MKWNIVDFEEGTDFDRQRGFTRFKRAIFMVNGTTHTLRISMKDFDEGRAKQLVEKEALKIIEVMEGSGSGSGKG